MLEDIFNIQNLLIFIALVLINLLMLRFSKRKRKYGIYPSGIFIFLFVAFLGAVVYHIANDKNDRTKLPGEVVINKTYGKPKYQTELKRKLYVKNASYEVSNLTLFMHYSLRFSTIQSIIALFFAIFGLLSVYNRNGFYYRMMVVHILAIIMCCITEASIV